MIDAKLEEERRKEIDAKLLKEREEKAERETKVKAVINLDKNGVAIEIIANSLQLTVEEVRQILDEYKAQNNPDE